MISQKTKSETLAMFDGSSTKPVTLFYNQFPRGKIYSQLISWAALASVMHVIISTASINPTVSRRVLTAMTPDISNLVQEDSELKRSSAFLGREVQNRDFNIELQNLSEEQNLSQEKALLVEDSTDEFGNSVSTPAVDSVSGRPMMLFNAPFHVYPADSFPPLFLFFLYLFEICNVATALLFFFEYLIRCFRAKDTPKYLFSSYGIVDLVAWLPFLLFTTSEGGIASLWYG